MTRILIVDDSIPTANMMSILLKGEGYEVSTVASKTALLDELSIYGDPDLILLDIIIQHEDGRQICKQIKKHNPTAKIILVSASPELLKEYKDCYADDIIEKPFDIKTLVDKVQALL